MSKGTKGGVISREHSTLLYSLALLLHPIPTCFSFFFSFFFLPPPTIRLARTVKEDTAVLDLASRGGSLASVSFTKAT